MGCARCEKMFHATGATKTATLTAGNYDGPEWNQAYMIIIEVNLSYIFLDKERIYIYSYTYPVYFHIRLKC
jgi:hypothetical protein